ncbi:hypothetical protein L204_102282 [Cryptococcus depauperatus]|nr:hypothetical protein L204_06011 [Cryptococcus depauperatus CBS 7855]
MRDIQDPFITRTRVQLSVSDSTARSDATSIPAPSYGDTPLTLDYEGLAKKLTHGVAEGMAWSNMDSGVGDGECYQDFERAALTKLQNTSQVSHIVKELVNSVAAEARDEAPLELDAGVDQDDTGFILTVHDPSQLNPVKRKIRYDMLEFDLNAPRTYTGNTDLPAVSRMLTNQLLAKLAWPTLQATTFAENTGHFPSRNWREIAKSKSAAEQIASLVKENLTSANKVFRFDDYALLSRLSADIVSVGVGENGNRLTMDIKYNDSKDVLKKHLIDVGRMPSHISGKLNLAEFIKDGRKVAELSSMNQTGTGCSVASTKR